MILLHRLYTWVMFPIIVTTYIAMQLLILLFSVLNNFTYSVFFIEIETPAPDDFPAFVPPGDFAKVEYLYRVIVAITMPAKGFLASLKALNTYKF